MDEWSDMDRGLEVGGGANGATPMDDSSSEDLGIPPWVGREYKWSQMKSWLTDLLSSFLPEVISQGEGEAQQHLGLVLRSSSEHAVSTASLLDEVPTPFEVNNFSFSWVSLSAHDTRDRRHCPFGESEPQSLKWACGKCCIQSWMKSQLMFEVNIGSSEPAASAAPKLDEVPTNVRSEHQLEVSSRQVLRPSWMKSQLMFEVNICSSERAVPLHNKLDEVPTLFEVNIWVTDLQSVWTSELEWATQQVLWLGKCPYARVSPSVLCFPRSERITDKFLRSKFQKLLEWPEPKLSRVRLTAVCYTVQPGMKSPGSLGEVPMMSLSHRLDYNRCADSRGRVTLRS